MKIDCELPVAPTPVMLITLEIENILSMLDMLHHKFILNKDLEKVMEKAHRYDGEANSLELRMCTTKKEFREAWHNFIADFTAPFDYPMGNRWMSWERTDNTSKKYLAKNLSFSIGNNTLVFRMTFNILIYFFRAITYSNKNYSTISKEVEILGKQHARNVGMYVYPILMKAAAELIQ